MAKFKVGDRVKGVEWGSNLVGRIISVRDNDPLGKYLIDWNDGGSPVLMKERQIVAANSTSPVVANDDVSDFKAAYERVIPKVAQSHDPIMYRRGNTYSVEVDGSASSSHASSFAREFEAASKGKFKMTGWHKQPGPFGGMTVDFAVNATRNSVVANALAWKAQNAVACNFDVNAQADKIAKAYMKWDRTHTPADEQQLHNLIRQATSLGVKVWVLRDGSIAIQDKRPSGGEDIHSYINSAPVARNGVAEDNAKYLMGKIKNDLMSFRNVMDVRTDDAVLYLNRAKLKDPENADKMNKVGLFIKEVKGAIDKLIARAM